MKKIRSKSDFRVQILKELIGTRIWAQRWCLETWNSLAASQRLIRIGSPEMYSFLEPYSSPNFTGFSRLKCPLQKVLRKWDLPMSPMTMKLKAREYSMSWSEKICLGVREQRIKAGKTVIREGEQETRLDYESLVFTTRYWRGVDSESDSDREREIGQPVGSFLFGDILVSPITSAVSEKLSNPNRLSKVATLPDQVNTPLRTPTSKSRTPLGNYRLFSKTILC